MRHSRLYSNLPQRTPLQVGWQPSDRGPGSKVTGSTQDGSQQDREALRIVGPPLARSVGGKGSVLAGLRC